VSESGAALVVDNLHVWRQHDQREILHDVSVHVGVGECVCVVGQSGSGKSILTKAILGLLPEGVRARGRIELAGRDVLSMPERQLRRLRGQSVGYIPQDPLASFNPTIRVARQMCETEILSGRMRPKESFAAAAAMLAAVRVPDPGRRARQYPHEMSGGMLQRALIAAATHSRPAILIADEPTTGLDVTNQAGIGRLLQELITNLQTSLLLVTHDIAFASQLAHRFVVLRDGQVVEEGPSADVVQHPADSYTRALIEASAADAFGPAQDRGLA
jgi:ABC-type dipeptide/oligopeptide/nickel transport system ATPase component